MFNNTSKSFPPHYYSNALLGAFTMIRPFSIIFIAKIFCFFTLVQADVKSTSSSINFDRNSDGNNEAILNSTGFGLGVTPSANLHVAGNAIITGELQVGGRGTFLSNLQINGTLGYSVSNFSSNTILSEQGSSSMILADNSSGNLFIYFPYAGNVAGRQYFVKNISTTYSTVVSARGSSNIEGLPFVVIKSSSGNPATASFLSDGSNWWITRSLGNIMMSGLEWSNTGYSTNVLWTPAQLTTTIWLDASKASSISLTNGNIHTWTDLSSSAYVFDQPTPTSQPQWGSANLLNGRNVAAFDGSNDYFKMDAGGPQPGSNNQMMLIVAQLNTNHDGRLFTMSVSGSSRNAIIPNYLESYRYNYNDTYLPAQSFTKISINTPLLFSAYRSGTTVQVGVSGNAEVGGGTGGNISTIERWYIGCLDIWNYLNGFIAEIVVVSSYDLTTYTKIQGYLAWKWGLQGNLPANHTYKNKPPIN